MARKNHLTSTPVRAQKARKRPIHSQRDLPKIPADIEALLDSRASKNFFQLVRKGVPKKYLRVILRGILMVENKRVPFYPSCDPEYPDKSFARRVGEMADEIERFNTFLLLTPARMQIALEAERNRSAFLGELPNRARVFIDTLKPGPLEALPDRLRSYAKWVRYAHRFQKRAHPKKGYRLKHEAIFQLLLLVRMWTGKNHFSEVADLLNTLHGEVRLPEAYAYKDLWDLWNRSVSNYAAASRVNP